MRNLTDHICSGDQAVQLEIKVLDEPGAGNACHQYDISWTDKNGIMNHEYVNFQNGPIKENGVNGVTGEAHLTIEIDRLRSFQDGPYKCRENAIALTHLEEALMWLKRRTVARINEE